MAGGGEGCRLKAGQGVTIVGGGLSGLTLGLRLRRMGVACEVWESQSYPRHRVCGEFLSGRGPQLLSELGLRSVLEQRGAAWGRTVAFFSESRTVGQATLPEPALCVSRYQLDLVLAEALVAEGGVLRVGERFAGSLRQPGVVRATGREPQSENGGWRWLGLKAHAFDVELTADLEMHFHPNAYVGLCRVEGGRVNVCGLFRSKVPLADVRRTWPERLHGVKGSPLWERLQGTRFDEASFSAVAALPLGGGWVRRPPNRGTEPSPNGAEFRVGDGCGMIPPVTGNGMSIALESASLAAPWLGAWSRGEVPWETAQSGMHADGETAFGGRLRWAALLQSAVMHPVARRGWAALFPWVPGLWRMAYARTR